MVQSFIMQYEIAPNFILHNKSLRGMLSFLQGSLSYGTARERSAYRHTLFI